MTSTRKIKLFENDSATKRLSMMINPVSIWIVYYPCWPCVCVNLSTWISLILNTNGSFDMCVYFCLCLWTYISLSDLKQKHKKEQKKDTQFKPTWKWAHKQAFSWSSSSSNVTSMNAYDESFYHVELALLYALFYVYIELKLDKKKKWSKSYERHADDSIRWMISYIYCLSYFFLWLLFCHR